MSPAPVPTAPPTLDRLAEVIHEAAAGIAESALVTVEYRPTDLALGFWPLPEGLDHPTDALVGWHAPATSHVVGLVTTGWATPYGPPPGQPGGPGLRPGPVEPPTRVRLTVLLDRRGASSTTLEREGGPLQPIGEVPLGWGADALARSLGLPTPAPTVRPSECIEGGWLDAIARLLFDERRDPRTWADLARLHPLAPPGDALPGALLAIETRALDLESDWGRLRRLYDRVQDPAGSVHPPSGTVVPLDEWFDDGSFSRWAGRRHPTPEDLLFDVLDALPTALGRELVDALTSVSPDALGHLDDLGARDWWEPTDDEPDPTDLDLDTCDCATCGDEAARWSRGDRTGRPDGLAADR